MVEPAHTSMLEFLIGSTITARNAYLQNIIDKETIDDEEMAVIRGLFEKFYQVESSVEEKYNAYEKNGEEYRFTF